LLSPSRSRQHPISIPPYSTLQSFVDHRDLHSFPTRRSSDLGIENRTTNCATLGLAGQVPTFVQNVTATDINAAIASCGQNQVVRSEEHTSELQSRGHLVCRLLLEKKNAVCNIERGPPAECR